MRACAFFLALTLWCALAGTVHALGDGDDVPEKAVCRTCEVRGSVHGVEDVAAWRDHDGARYFFCAEDCAKAFDSFPEAYVPQPLPRPAPSVSVVGLTGEIIDIGAQEGQVVLLDFWATWCSPCIKAMPKLNAMQAEWSDGNFTVLGVSIDDEKAAEVVPPFVDKKKIRYTIALDNPEAPAWQAFRVAAIPAMFLIDGNQRIVAAWRGDVDMDEVRKTVEELVSKNSK